MPPHATPHQFAADNLGAIRQHWTGVRGGDAESIHQARIATRRLRAALAVIDGASSDRIKVCRRLGRALGAVRESDVTQEIFATLATRVPSAASVIAAVRPCVEDEQRRARRRLIKSLEVLKLRPLTTLGDGPPLLRLTLFRDWRHAIESEIVSRQRALSRALDRAPGLYMPKRLHRVRIAAKKLRYTLELGAAIGLSIDARAMRALTKSQEVLGRLHDAATAQRVLKRLDVHGNSMATETHILNAVMNADCVALHDKYLGRREQLQAVCDGSPTIDAGRRQWSELAVTALPAAGFVALRIAVWLLGPGAEGPQA